MVTDIVQNLTNYISENIDSVEKIIGIIGVLFGAPITLIKGMSDFMAFVSSSKIEISFMTKKERMKLNITNVITMFVAFFFSNCVCGYMSRNYLELCVVFLLFGIVGLFIIMIIGGYRIVRRIHCIRMLFFLIRKIISKIYDRIRDCIWRKIKEKQCVTAVLNMGKKIIENTKRLWEESGVPETKIVDKKQARGNIAENILFFSIAIIELSINSCVWSAAIEQNVPLYIPLFASILLTILLLEVLFLLVRKNLFMMEAKVYIYVENSETPLYIFFRYDEKYCIAGNEPVLERASEYCLYEYDKMLGKTIYPVSKLNEKCKELSEVTATPERKQWEEQEEIRKKDGMIIEPKKYN